MKRILLAVVLTLLHSPVHAGISEEMPVSPIVREVADGTSPQIGVTRDQTLVVWSPVGEAAAAFYAARVSSDGTLLDSTPIQISSSSGTAIVTGGSDRYLIVWGTSTGWSVAIIGTDGSVIRNQTWPSENGEWRIPRAAVFNGSEFLVTWHVVRNSTSGENVATIVSANGEITRDGIPLNGEVDAAASSGSDFLVASRKYEAVQNCGPCRFTAVAQTISAAGETRVAHPLFVWDLVAAPDLRVNDVSVSATADGYLLTWIESTLAPRADVKVMPLDRGGASAGPAQTIYTQPGFFNPPLKAFRDGDDTIIFAGATYTKVLRYSRVSGASAPVDLPDNNAAVAWNGRDLVVANVHPLRLNFYDRTFTHDSSMPADLAIAYAATKQETPALATNGRAVAAIWTEYRAGDRQIRARLFTRFGPAGEEILLGRGSMPAIASDGDGYLAAYVSGKTVTVQRISATGEVSPAVPFPLVNDLESNPAIVWNGSEYLVVFAGNIYFIWSDQTIAIYGVRVRRDGTLIDPQPVPISESGGWRDRPAVAWNGSDYLVAWSEQKCVDLCYDPKRKVWQYGVSGALLAPSLERRQTMTIRPFGGAAVRDSTSAAWNGDTFLVAWGENSGIYGTRVDAAGATLGPDPQLLIGVEAQSWATHPKLSARGASFVVTYDAQGDIYAAAFDFHNDQTLPLAPGAGAPLATSADAEIEPALTIAPDFTAVAYVRFASEPEYGGSGKVFVRFDVEDSRARRRAARH